MTAKNYGVLIQLRWNNPYTEPPNGIRVLAEIFRPQSDPDAHTPPPEFAQLHTLGDGYGTQYTFPALTAPRELSPETLASVRKKRTSRRIQAKYPLFADQFIQAELDRKPDYYAGITRPDLQAGIDRVKTWEAERLSYLTAHLGEVLIYAKSHSITLLT